MVRTANLLLPLLVPFLLAGSADDPIPTRPMITIDTQQAQQREMAEWGIERFDRAGLALPPMVIRFPGSDLSLCGNAAARAYPARDPIEVRMCWNDRFLLLHELGHIWVETNVPSSRRRAFMALRDDVQSWAGRTHDWANRGQEHAANVVAWGVLEDPRPVSKTYPNDPRSMIDGFTLLTGVDPLHDGGPGVQRPDRSLFADRTNQPLESGR